MEYGGNDYLKELLNRRVVEEKKLLRKIIKLNKRIVELESELKKMKTKLDAG